MRTLAQSAYLESEFGTLSELPSVGTPLENPYVYDSSARELKEWPRKAWSRSWKSVDTTKGRKA